jgi:hypothetical protein
MHCFLKIHFVPSLLDSVTMSTPSQLSSKPYTLTLLTPSTGTPTFLRHLQRSDLDTVWLGEFGGFFRKSDPSTWPWSLIVLAEGQRVKLPTRCQTAQTWTFEIEAEKAFQPDPRSDVPDESEADWKDGNKMSETVLFQVSSLYQCAPSHIRRFCVLVFHTEAVEQSYKQHLETITQNLELGEKLGIRIQLAGRILKSEEKLGIRAKIPVVKASKGRKKKWISWDQLEKLDSETPSLPSPDSSPTMLQLPSFDHFVMMSFPSPKEYEQYLLSNERKGLEEVVGKDEMIEGMILAKHLVLPPKDEPISPSDWSYGNPHEPYGQDWFG